jgi:hypothetical protein
MLRRFGGAATLADFGNSRRILWFVSPAHVFSENGRALAAACCLQYSVLPPDDVLVLGIAVSSAVFDQKPPISTTSIGLLEHL